MGRKVNGVDVYKKEMIKKHNKLNYKKYNQYNIVTLPDHEKFPVRTNMMVGTSIPVMYNTDQYVIGAKAISRAINKGVAWVLENCHKHKGIPHLQVGIHKQIIVDREQLIQWAREHGVEVPTNED